MQEQGHLEYGLESAFTVKIFVLRDGEPSVSDMIDRPTEATLTLTLPDGSQRAVPAGTLPSDVVKSIGERLLQAAVAVEVNGAIQDLVTPLRSSGTFRVLTDRDASALEVLRHSADLMVWSRAAVRTSSGSKGLNREGKVGAERLHSLDGLEAAASVGGSGMRRRAPVAGEFRGLGTRVGRRSECQLDGP